MGQTVQYTVQVTGGDPNAQPAWTCASSDTTVATTDGTSAGCAATGVGPGTTTITATVTRGTATVTATASLVVVPPPLVVTVTPAADTVQIGDTTLFIVEATGGDPSAELEWACTSDTTVAAAAVTDTGCSATGTGTGTTSIDVTVTRGSTSAMASASLLVVPPPLTATLSPAADTVEVGQTVRFAIQVMGGDPAADPVWTCASADTLIATTDVTGRGCTATGTGTGTTTIAATITRRTMTATASASLRVVPRAPGPRDAFAYWDANGNGDLTCTEARGRDEGLRLPAYRDNRNGTALIYQWLQRGRSSDTDGDGIACESSNNPGGYVPVPPPTTTGDRFCPSDSPTWMGLPVCDEAEREGYDRDAFGSAYSTLEDDIIDALPQVRDSVYTPYTCALYAIRPDGTAATDIEHIVALAEAYDSGLPESRFRDFAADLLNLTIADPTVNRHQKSDRDAGDWTPPRNQGWFASKVVAVKRRYGLSLNPAERDALASMLAADTTRTVKCD